MHEAVTDFAIRLICGVGLALCVMPRKDVPSAFFRIMLLVVLGLAVVWTLSAWGTKGAAWWGVAAGGAAFAGSVCWLMEMRRVGTAAIAAIFVLSAAAALGGQGGATSATRDGHSLLAGASTLASAATLGAAFTGMLWGIGI